MLDGLTLLGLLLFLVLWFPNYKKHGKMREILVSELQEAWRMREIERAGEEPTAITTRRQPVI
ncbi:unnamed protein product [Brassica rapa subsp. trilocularis]